jgi:TATA-box binding protein (TBP) (component of TFIID and TFIIIB)
MICDVDEEWENFCSSTKPYDEISSDDEQNNIIETNYTIPSLNMEYNSDTPVASNIYISTKTKIAYLNSFIDIKNIFWKIPIISYSEPKEGIIKKQIKINSNTIQELDEFKEKLKKELYYEENIITNINNPTGRIQFKDIRKISIGLCTKDIMSYRCQKKSAFYNCFVLIMRLKINKSYKEFHVKVFNTGKLEIPGIQSEDTFQIILQNVLNILQPHISNKLELKPIKIGENGEDLYSETVLINSNFNCGFFIDREALHDLLKYKYKIHTMYDPCSYPGVQCKIYYKKNVGIQINANDLENEVSKDKNSDITKVSFMIFRTGSVLIVGNCEENVLHMVYDYLKIILNNEYKKICQYGYLNKNAIPETDVFINEIDTENPTVSETQSIQEKKKKIRRKVIYTSI